MLIAGTACYETLSISTTASRRSRDQAILAQISWRWSRKSKSERALRSLRQRQRHRHLLNLLQLPQLQKRKIRNSQHNLSNRHNQHNPPRQKSSQKQWKPSKPSEVEQMQRTLQQELRLNQQPMLRKTQLWQKRRQSQLSHQQTPMDAHQRKLPGSLPKEPP